MNKLTLNTRHPGLKLIKTTEAQLLTQDNINRVKQLKTDIMYIVGIDEKGNLLIGTDDNLFNADPQHFTIGHLFKDNDQTVKLFYCGYNTYLPSEGEFYNSHPYCSDETKRLDERATDFIKKYYRYYKQHRRQAAQSFKTVDDSIANLVDVNAYIDYVAKSIEHFNLDEIKMGLLTANIERFAQQLLARKDLHSILENNTDLVCFLDSFYFGDIRSLKSYDIKKKKSSLQLLRNATDIRNKVTNLVRKECPSYYYYLRRQYAVEIRQEINQLIA